MRWMMVVVMVAVMMMVIELATEICLCHRLPPTSTQSNVVPSLRLFSLSLEPFYTDGGPTFTLYQGA